MKRLTPQAFSRFYPAVYHMAAAGSWESIRSLGLLSTRTLVDAFEVAEPLASQLLREHRPESVTVHHPVHGTAVVRDQKSMSHKGLEQALPEGTSPNDWLELLNSMVFFWPTLERLRRFVHAHSYRYQRKTVLVLESAALLASAGSRIRLSPLNSGSTCYAHPRTPDGTFLSLGEYPFYERKSRGLKPVAEVCVVGRVSGVASLTRLAVEIGGGEEPSVLYGDVAEHDALFHAIGEPSP